MVETAKCLPNCVFSFLGTWLPGETFYETLQLDMAVDQVLVSKM